MGLQPNPSKWDASRFLGERMKARSERGALMPFMSSRLAGRNNKTVNKWLVIKEHPFNIFRRHEKATKNLKHAAKVYDIRTRIDSFLGTHKPVADLDLQIRGGGGGHPDPEIRGGPVFKNFFRLFGRPFSRKIRGAGPPGPSPRSATASQSNRLLKCKENHSKLSEIFGNITPKMPHSHQRNMFDKHQYQKNTTQTFYTEFKWTLTRYVIALNLQSKKVQLVAFIKNWQV